MNEGDKIDELQRAINKLRDELAKIDGNMDTEMINMDNETLDEDVREQARQDYDTYVLQQENLIKTMEISNNKPIIQNAIIAFSVLKTTVVTSAWKLLP